MVESRGLQESGIGGEVDGMGRLLHGVVLVPVAGRVAVKMAMLVRVPEVGRVAVKMTMLVLVPVLVRMMEETTGEWKWMSFMHSTIMQVMVVGSGMQTRVMLVRGYTQH